MAELFAFRCSSCGEIHEGSPSFAFCAPDPYVEQPGEIQAAGALGTDTCPDADALKAQVHLRSGTDRPDIALEDTDHPLAIDARRGISIERAQAIAEAVLHG